LYYFFFAVYHRAQEPHPDKNLEHRALYGRLFVTRRFQFHELRRAATPNDKAIRETVRRGGHQFYGRPASIGHEVD
jgi:hypothetical protein